MQMHFGRLSRLGQFPVLLAWLREGVWLNIMAPDTGLGWGYS